MVFKIKQEALSILRSPVSPIFFLALLARIAFLLWRGAILAPDTTSYTRLANNILDHGAFSLSELSPFNPTIRRAPLYPTFLAIMTGLGFASPMAVAIIQALIDSAVAAAVFIYARQVAPLKWALFVAFLYVLHPGAILASASLLSETLFTAISVVAIGFVYAGMKRDNIYLTAVGGVVLGLAALCRPVALLILCSCAIAIIFSRGLSRRWVHVTALSIMMIVTIIPWAVRCSIVSHQLILIQGASAVNFYLPTRWDWDQKDQEHLWSAFAEEDEYGKQLNASTNPEEMVEADKFGFHKAMENVRANPTGYIRSRLSSFPYLFLSSFDSFTGLNQSFGSLRAQGDWLRLGIKLALITLFSVVPLLLAVMGLFRIKTQNLALLCASVWIYTLLIHIPMWIEYRFWVPALPFLLVNAAAGANLLSSLCNKIDEISEEKNRVVEHFAKKGLNKFAWE